MDCFPFLLILVAVIAIAYYIDWRQRNRENIVDTEGMEGSDLVELRGNDEYELEIVGESHYQDALEAICGPRKTHGEEKYVEAFLHLEDDNKYDKNAVRVQIDGKVVGYLTRDVAKFYREQLRKSGHPRALGTCNAVIRGGWERKNSKGSYGLFLDIPVE